METVQEMFESSSEELNGRISSQREWETFCKRLLTANVLDEEDVKRLNRAWAKTRPFGSKGKALSFDEFTDIIVEEFGSRAKTEELNVVETSLRKVLGQIDNLQAMCKSWDPSRQELVQMMRLVVDLKKDQTKASSVVEGLRQKYDSVFLSGWAGQEGFLSEESTGCFFQNKYAKDIERICASTRVRGQVKFVDSKGARRSTALKLSDKLGHVRGRSLDVCLAKSNDGDLIEVVHLDSSSGTDADVAFACNCHAAHRELLLSVHFPRWMGYSKHSALYFEYFPDAVPVETMIKKHGILIEPQPLLYSILSNTLEALCELVEQSTFEILEPISLSNLFLVNEGTRVILGRIRWGEKKSFEAHEIGQEGWLKWNNKRRESIIKSFGDIIRSLIGVDKSNRMSLEENSADDSTGTESSIHIFNRAECESGLRVFVGTRFKFDFPTSTPNKVWRCVKIVDYGSEAVSKSSTKGFQLQSQVIQVESQEIAQFKVLLAGSCRMFFREVEWWQSYDLDVGNAISLDGKEDSDERTEEFRGASIMCKVTAIDKREQLKLGQQACSPSLQAILAACTPTISRRGIWLRHLQKKYQFLQVSPENAPRVVDDFEVHLQGKSIGLE